jgi:hypothetical protein
MPADALTVLQSPKVTKTATFNSTGVDLVTSTPRRGLKARIIYSAASTSAGAGSITFRITESSDNSTFTGIYQTTEATVTLSTTAVSGEIFIPFETSKRYVRLELSAISGTGATVDYLADISLVRP